MEEAEGDEDDEGVAAVVGEVLEDEGGGCDEGIPVVPLGRHIRGGGESTAFGIQLALAV